MMRFPTDRLREQVDLGAGRSGGAERLLLPKRQRENKFSPCLYRKKSRFFSVYGEKHGSACACCRRKNGMVNPHPLRGSSFAKGAFVGNAWLVDDGYRLRHVTAAGARKRPTVPFSRHAFQRNVLHVPHGALHSFIFHSVSPCCRIGKQSG